jgi:iron(III) transport system ATP-binding protein
MGLKIDDARHGYAEDDVIRGVSVAVTAGEVVGLLGPSGCGKTTLLRLAAGLEPLRGGRVIIGGRVVADAADGLHVAPEARRVGLMFQDFALFPHLSVRDNVAFGLNGRARHRQAWVTRAMQRVGLEALADSFPHTLSGGEQQRCALIRALAPEPQVLLLDEPFSGLDVTLRCQVREETLDFLRETGVATLFITHDPEEAMFMADRIFVMDAGRVVQEGTPAAIYLHPASPFVASLFGPVNRLDGVVRDHRVSTALGPVIAADIADGTAATVLVRPEGLIVGAEGTGVGARVVSARLLGRASHLVLAVSGTDTPMQALVPGVVLPEPGVVVGVQPDPRHVFVFRAG